MMSPDNIPANPVNNDDNHSSGGRKNTTPRLPEQALNCPRCDSPNTKFCYYNNYSLTQPRHFCKTCKRYWTKGGALRNVPIGGGYRRNKKIKSGSRLSGESSETGGMEFFHGLSPSMDFKLGGLPFSRLFSSTTDVYNQFSSFQEFSNPSCFDINPAGSSGSLLGFSYPVCSDSRQGENGGFNGGIQQMGSMNVHESNLATSIESLSSLNQDLHWKLQQQRLAMLFGGENQKESSSVSSVTDTLLENHFPKPQPILFQNLEISKPDVCAVSNPRKNCVGGNTTAEWFFESSYTPTSTNSSGNGNDNPSAWNGIQAWTDSHQYREFP